MESLSTLSVRFAFGRHAGLSEELASHLREENRRRAFEAARQDEVRRRRKAEEKREDDESTMALIAMVALATDAAIAEFRAKLDRYDVAMIEALLENERELAAVRERLQRALDEAVWLPNGRRVFKTRDGTRVFDEHGEAVDLDEIRPEDISDTGMRFEDYWADRTRHQALSEEREELLTYQKCGRASGKSRAGDCRHHGFPCGGIKPSQARLWPIDRSAHGQRAMGRPTHDGFPGAWRIGSKMIRSLVPVAAASRSSVRVDGLTLPLSSRAITPCLVPIRCASSSCVSPAARRARSSENSPSSASYSAR